MRTTSTTPRDVEELVAWCVRQAQGGNRRACSWFSIRTTLRVACVDSPEESGTRYLGQAIPEETHTHEIVHGQYNASVNEQRERAIPRTATHLQTKVLCWYANGEGQSTDGRVLLQFLDSSQNVIQELLLCSLNFRPGGSSGGGNSGNEVGGIVPIPRDATHQRSVILAAGSRWAKQFKFSGIPLR
jgi:hypothetical protein